MARLREHLTHLGLVNSCGIPNWRYRAFATGNTHDTRLLVQFQSQIIKLFDGAQRRRKFKLLGGGRSGVLRDGYGRFIGYQRRRIGDLLATHLRGRLLHGIQDLGVFTAAADVARERFFDLLIRWILVGLKKSVRGHDESASADAALEAALQPERPLERMQSVDAGPAGDAAHCQNFLAAAVTSRQQRAPVNRPAIHQYGARAALRAVATEIAVRLSQLVVECFPQALANIDRNIVFLSVDV